MLTSDGEPTPKRRWWVVKEQTYKCNIVCNARVKGEGYIAYSGKQVPEKPKLNMDSLTCKCNVKCSLIINIQTLIKMKSKVEENIKTQDKK